MMQLVDYLILMHLDISPIVETNMSNLIVTLIL